MEIQKKPYLGNENSKKTLSGKWKFEKALSGKWKFEKNLIWEMKIWQNLIWVTDISDLISISHGEMGSGALIISLGKWKKNH